jgi:hypothetical protein
LLRLSSSAFAPIAGTEGWEARLAVDCDRSRAPGWRIEGVVGAGVVGTDADGTEPSLPPSSPEDDESEESEARFKARRWRLDILRARLGRGSDVDIYKRKISIEKGQEMNPHTFASRELNRTETV